ncbi:hypothetical protein L195_g046446 [Trifolium pratense]|uniref:TIR-NBS-LRR resistance protein n=1 Tax=Trifolium pratense TaxID=57577 RepID=A0A2K3MHQ6_TRIPR|nr:hypothetical protein L195_g046446 [Trifolium pratense]
MDDNGCLLPGDSYPNWLTFNCEDSSVTFEVPQVEGHEEGQRVVSSIEPGNKVEVVVVFENGFIVKKTAVYLIYDDEPIAEIVDECPAQDKNAVVDSILVKEASPQLALVYDLAHRKRKTVKEWLGFMHKVLATNVLVSEEWGSWKRQVVLEVDSEATILILKG